MTLTLSTSKIGRDLIMQYEGLRLRAYPDPGTGSDPWTIGYGHTGPDVRPGMSITREEADTLLSRDLEKHEREVRRLCKGARTPQSAFDALVSFDFNTGALHRSTLLRCHRKGWHNQAAREFHRWVYAGGRVLRGLQRRRAAEAALYVSAFSAQLENQ